MIGGLQIIENPHLLEPDVPDVVKRTWRERLFTRPWRPLQATRLVPRFKPSRAVYQIGNRLVMHPYVANEVRRVLKTQS